MWVGVSFWQFQEFLVVSSVDSKPSTRKDKAMGISIITALEIFTNPGDLEITIGQENEGSKFAFGIFRGPGHNFKPMLTSQPFAETQEDAIKTVEGILQTVHEAIAKEFKDSGSPASQYLNPDGQEIDQSKVLNQELITRILEELRAHGKESTCKILIPTV